MKDSVIERQVFLRGVGGLRQIAAVPALDRLRHRHQPRRQRRARAHKTLVVRNSGGAYGER